MASKRALTFAQWQQEKRGVHKGSIPFHYLNGEPLYREEDTYPLTNYSEFKRGRGKPHRQGYRSRARGLAGAILGGAYDDEPLGQEPYHGSYHYIGDFLFDGPDDFDDNCGAINH